MSAPTVTSVTEASPAARAGLAVGDELLSLNGQEPRDVIDFQQLTDADDLSVMVKRAGAALPRLVKIDKSPGEPFGVEVSSAVFDRIRTCDNHCAFCFIYQLPKGMRKSLYLKDDDYRLSFLYGNFTTLTRFTELDAERILTERLGPLFVSIHSTDPALRADMLRNPKGATSLRWLQVLLDGGIEVHGQIVVCPGVNDGAALEDTLAGILDRFPLLATVGVVPLGISQFSHEATMRAHTTQEAAFVVDTVAEWQAIFKATLGRRLAYVADEYYLLAGRDFPAARQYDEFPQHENGIGMARAFVDAFSSSRKSGPGGVRHGFFASVDSAPAAGYRAPRLPVVPGGHDARPVTVLTGTYGARILRPHVPPPAPAPEVTTAKFPQSTERPGKSVELNMPKKAPSLEGRAKPEAHKNLGLKVELPHANPTPEQRALNPFKERVENLTQSGKAAKAIVEKEDKALYKTANEKFEISKKLNKAAKEEKPDLVKELTKIRKDISKIPEPSPVQKRLQNSIDTFVDSIVKKNKNGEIVGFKKVANQTMIEQMQSWKQIVDYEFAHGDPANIYKLAIGALENSIEKSMVGKEAVAAWKEAKATYKEWAQTFNNDYVNPFRSATNKDYAKNFEKLTKDFDYFNQVAPVLERDAAGKQLIDSARREIVENTFGKFFKDPTSMTRKEALKELKELEAVLTPQQVKSVEEGINEALAKEPITFKATYEPVVKRPKERKVIEKGLKQLKMTEEQVWGKFNTRTGIREVRDTMQKANVPEIYNTFRQVKTRDILFKGQVEANPTGKEIAEIINLRKNRELLEEMWGKEAIDDFYLLSKELGEKEMKDASKAKFWDRIKNSSQKAVVMKLIGAITEVASAIAS